MTHFIFACRFIQLGLFFSEFSLLDYPINGATNERNGIQSLHDDGQSKFDNSFAMMQSTALNAFIEANQRGFCQHFRRSEYYFILRKCTLKLICRSNICTDGSNFFFRIPKISPVPRCVEFGQMICNQARNASLHLLRENVPPCRTKCSNTLSPPQ